MKLSWTLSRYIGKQFLFAIAVVLAGLVAMILMVDSIELLRRAASHEEVPFGAIIGMALLKSPNMAERLLPFAVLIGSMVALTKLTRSHELVVARAAGVSVWQFLLPALAVVIAAACLFITVFNPLSAVMLLKFEQLEGKYITGKSSLMAVSPSGLWLRQIEHSRETGLEHIIHASRISQADMSFSNVMIVTFSKDGKFLERLDADRAVLTDGALTMDDVTYSVPGQPTEYRERYTLATDLRMEQIQDSFTSPETMPFWTLPSFIHTLEKAGFSALRHKIYWHSLLSSPLLLAGMVLLAAIFSLRLPRRGRVMALVVAGTACGFLLHFMTDIVHALGAAGTLPIALAAWTPALIIISIGTGMLLHLEDG